MFNYGEVGGSNMLLRSLRVTQETSGSRWAKSKGGATPAAATVSAPAPKKKRRMSAAGRAAIKAA